MDFSIKYRYNKLLAGSERTKVVKKNVLGSFGIKGLSILTSFILVPFTINMLNQEKYGIWITIFSIVNWFNMMDMGLGNGFRNKFAVAIALNKKVLANIYIQTLYSSMALIAGSLLLLYFAINPFLNWYHILNIPNGFDENINIIIGSVFVLFCGQLILKNVATILLSLQKTTFNNSLGLAGNILALFLIYLFSQFYKSNLLSIALIFMISPLIVYSIATLVAFNKYLKEYKPALFVLPQKKYFNELMSLGLKFFFIQITTIVMFSSSSIIIAQLFGPAEVTPYNVTYQLFVAVQVFFGIIINPFWTAFTEANAKRDYNWIKNSIKKLILIWGLFSMGIVALWLISPFVFKIWLGNKISISYNLSFQFALFTILSTWTNIFVSYINGIGKIKLQLYIAIFQFIVNIPLAIILAKYFGLNTSGIILATNLNLLIPAIIIPIQYKRLINNKAYGIWSE